MSKTLALDFGCVLRTTSALDALGFFLAVLPVQQLLAGGPNLFAPSREVGRELDAARALPITAFYAPVGLKTNAVPGALVRSEPAREYALPPGLTATRILYHTQTARRSRFITHLLSTDAAPPAECSRRTSPRKSFIPAGKTTNTFANFWRDINRESYPLTAPCCWWVAETTSCSRPPPARKSLSAFAVPGTRAAKYLSRSWR
jgi:hypothetical protein